MNSDSPPRPFHILSLDGGGIKGLFSAAVLAALEEDSGTHIADHFDLITGTSTGGIIALGLGAGLRPREIVQFYVNEGPKIFGAHLLSDAKQYVSSKFSSANLEQALKTCFKDQRLADSKKRLVVPSYNLGEDDVYIFKTPHHERFKRDYKVPLWKVAMATSAAPTFLPAFDQLDGMRLIDGGVWANNPILVGIVEATSVLSAQLETIRVLSLGTTDEIKQRPQDLDGGGFWQWKKAASDVIMRGQSVGATAQAMHLLGKDKVLRLNPPVPSGLFALDKLTTKELIAKAAHESRKLMPEFKEQFTAHVADAYSALHQ